MINISIVHSIIYSNLFFNFIEKRALREICGKNEREKKILAKEKSCIQLHEHLKVKLYFLDKVAAANFVMAPFSVLFFSMYSQDKICLDSSICVCIDPKKLLASVILYCAYLCCVF